MNRILCLVAVLFFAQISSAQIFDVDTATTYLTPGELSKAAAAKVKNTGGLAWDVTWEVVKDDLIGQKPTWTEGQFCDCSTCYSSFDYPKNENCSTVNASSLQPNEQYLFTWKVNPGVVGNIDDVERTFILAAAEVNTGMKDTVVFIVKKDPHLSAESNYEEINTSSSIWADNNNALLNVRFFVRNNIDYSISVVNIVGEQVLVAENKNEIGNIEKTLDISALENGIYLVNVEFEGQFISRKVVIQK